MFIAAYPKVSPHCYGGAIPGSGKRIAPAGGRSRLSDRGNV